MTRHSSELLEAERLRDVVISAALESGHGVFDAVASGEDDDRQPSAAIAELAQHDEAVATGQPDVEDEQVEVVGIGEVERIAPVFGDGPAQ